MSRRYRFLAPEAGRNPDIRLDAAESHYLRRVLRLAPGARCEVFDGAGAAFSARFASADPDGRCRLERGLPLPPGEPETRLEVAVALPKGDRLTGIVRQLAEVGAASVTPLVTERAEGSPAPARRGRWQAAALAGARQCGRALVPAVRPPLAFREWVRGELPPGRFVATPGGPGEPAPRIVPGECALAVGPEGGFSPEELAAAAASGFARLDLGERVLGAGTAAVVGAAALLATRNRTGRNTGRR